MVVGIAGKYCAGKSTVSTLLAEHGYEVIDVDALGHEALERKQAEIIARFGPSILGQDGGIDRRRLGRIVFADAESKAALETIVHPEMKEMTRERLRNIEPHPAAINAAILFEMGLDELCDVVLWVTAPFLKRLLRAAKRDKLPLLQLLSRFRAQRRMGPQSSRENVDIEIVRNSSDNTARLTASLRELELI
jgi:dephospho-CoA kinase